MSHHSPWPEPDLDHYNIQWGGVKAALLRNAATAKYWPEIFYRFFVTHALQILPMLQDNPNVILDNITDPQPRDQNSIDRLMNEVFSRQHGPRSSAPPSSAATATAATTTAAAAATPKRPSRAKVAGPRARTLPVLSQPPSATTATFGPPPSAVAPPTSFAKWYEPLATAVGPPAPSRRPPPTMGVPLVRPTSSSASAAITPPPSATTGELPEIQSPSQVPFTPATPASFLESPSEEMMFIAGDIFRETVIEETRALLLRIVTHITEPILQSENPSAAAEIQHLLTVESPWTDQDLRRAFQVSADIVTLI